MRRAEILAVLGIAGCMRIYPDPELPDARVEWFEGACDRGTDVTITLDGIDDTTVHFTQMVTCATAQVTFTNVPRQRYHVTGQLLDDTGQLANTGESEIDLRNGLDVTGYVELGGFENFRVAWTFPDGESCASLGIDVVDVELLQAGVVQLAYAAACNDLVHADTAPFGTFAIQLIGYSGDTAVAKSPPTPEMQISFGLDVDYGLLVLSPCTGPCVSAVRGGAASGASNRD